MPKKPTVMEELRNGWNGLKRAWKWFGDLGKTSYLVTVILSIIFGAFWIIVYLGLKMLILGHA